MIDSKRISIAILMFAAFVFMGQGCITLSFGAPKVQDGGMYSSEDKGEAWKQKVFAGIVKKKTQTISNANISKILFHPFNPKQIFAGISNGVILKSDDSGASWNALPSQADKAEIRDIIFHPNDPSFMIAVTPSSGIFKSADRGTTWMELISKETA